VSESAIKLQASKLSTVSQIISLLVLLGSLFTFGAKLNAKIDAAEVSATATRAAVDALVVDMKQRPDSEDVKRMIRDEISGLKISEQLTELRALMGVVREDLKDLKHGK